VHAQAALHAGRLVPDRLIARQHVSRLTRPEAALIRRFAPALLALSVAVASLAAAHAARSADAPVMKLEATAGDSLSPSETAAVSKALSDYLEALRKKDYVKAGGYIDRASLLASSEATLQSIEPDSTKRDSACARVFGVPNRAALAKKTT